MTAVIKSQSEFVEAQKEQNPLSKIPYHADRENRFRLSLITESPGMIEVPGLRNTLVSIHVGVRVQVSCRSGGYSHQGMAIDGDLDLIPPRRPLLRLVQHGDTPLLFGV